MIVDWSRSLAYCGAENLILMPWSGIRTGLELGAPIVVTVPRHDRRLDVPYEALQCATSPERRQPSTLAEVRHTPTSSPSRVTAPYAQDRTGTPKGRSRIVKSATMNRQPSRRRRMWVKTREEERRVTVSPRKDRVEP